MSEAIEDKTVPENEAEKPGPPLSRRILKKVLFLLYILILLEVGSRAYWSIKGMGEGTNLPVFPGRSDWDIKFYEEIGKSGIMETETSRDDEQLDILFLGGSALDRVHRSLADKTKFMLELFEKAAGRPVRIFNLAEPAMTTRDSLIKYRLMHDYGKVFDLVVVYHGINDARMNCCPPELFRDDYTHGAFYHQYQRMESYGWPLNIFTLPYTIEYTAIHIMDSKKLDFGFYVPRHRMKEDWVKFGTDIRTKKPFNDNLTGIIDLAAKRKERLCLITFASYIPSNYSVEDLKEGKLDYSPTKGPSAVELWGSVEGVVKAIDVHNDVIRSLADISGVMFIDAAKDISSEGVNFHDVCHLSEEGKKRIAALLAEKLKETLNPQ